VNEANNRPDGGIGDRGGFSRSNSVPRPPDATLHSGANRNMRTQQEPAAPRSGAISNGTESANRGGVSRPSGTMNVPRPTTNNGGRNENMPHRTETPTMNTPRSGGRDRSAPISRPTPSAPSGNNGRSEQRTDSPRSVRQSDGGPRSMNVPRPTGPVRQASNQTFAYRGGSQANRGYSSEDRGNYNRGGSNQSPRSYGSYDRGGNYPSPRSYGSADRSSYSQSPRSYGSAQRSYPSSPRYSAPSMSGDSGHYSQGSSNRGNVSASRASGGNSSHSNGGGHGRGR
jgi:hypothetical protein